MRRMGDVLHLIMFYMHGLSLICKALHVPSSRESHMEAPRSSRMLTLKRQRVILCYRGFCFHFPSSAVLIPVTGYGCNHSPTAYTHPMKLPKCSFETPSLQIPQRYKSGNIAPKAQVMIFEIELPALYVLNVTLF